jgi:hypothetical protein
MPRKKKIDEDTTKTKTTKKTQKEVESSLTVASFHDVRDELVKILKGLSDGSIPSAVAKTQCYILQTLLSALKLVHEQDDMGQDSVRELCQIIKEQRESQEKKTGK